jgi:ABC-type lipoprotein release transport system permease subunit
LRRPRSASLGGIAGVTLGWLVGRAVNFGANIYIERQGGTAGNLFSLPFWLIGGAIGFSWVVSLIAGSYPAARAAPRSDSSLASRLTYRFLQVPSRSLWNW